MSYDEDYRNGTNQPSLNKWQAAQAQYQALGNQNLGLGKQYITDHQALGQQWMLRAQQQYQIADLAKCEEARQDHLDNAARFEQWAREADRTDDTSHSSQEIDYFAITREVSR